MIQDRFEPIQKRKNVMLYAVVTPKVKHNVKQLAAAMGITLSEYVRSLVIKDLDHRSLFTDDVKRHRTQIGDL